MKLRDLNPKFVNGILVFDCPCGNCGGRVRVPVAPRVENDHSWQSSGEYPDMLTLTPSVNAGCWHGHITNGAITA